MKKELMMGDIKRHATAKWSGDLKSGNGELSGESGYFTDLPYTFASRFESGKGSNPEELIGAAHAGCFNMVVAKELAAQGNPPDELTTKATVTLAEAGGGFRIAAVHLHLWGKVPNTDKATFKKVAERARDNCPVSQLLKPGLDEVTIEVELGD
jgi:lipoyl-dependent peroxiredoxin